MLEAYKTHFSLVHGDIRPLEISHIAVLNQIMVHGDIRHLEISYVPQRFKICVHGDIRHLENRK